MINEENKKEESKNLLKKFALYGGIFAIGIFILIFNKVVGDQNQTNQKENTKTPQTNASENETLKILSEINDNFYSMTVYLTLDDDAITLDYQKVKDIEMGEKKYHKEQTEYIKANNTYYIMENNNFNKTDNFIDFDFDKTFINLSNIKELLKCNGEYSKDTQGNYNIEKYTYSIKDVIKIYNNYNNESVITTGKGSITLTSYFKNEKLEYIELNTTDLYNLIENQNLKEVKYKITVTQEQEDDASWILEKLS